MLLLGLAADGIDLQKSDVVLPLAEKVGEAEQSGVFGEWRYGAGKHGITKSCVALR